MSDTERYVSHQFTFTFRCSEERETNASLINFYLVSNFVSDDRHNACWRYKTDNYFVALSRVRLSESIEHLSLSLRSPDEYYRRHSEIDIERASVACVYGSSRKTFLRRLPF